MTRKKIKREKKRCLLGLRSFSHSYHYVFESCEVSSDAVTSLEKVEGTKKKKEKKSFEFLGVRIKVSPRSSTNNNKVVLKAPCYK
jgi:hypothetical protein